MNTIDSTRLIDWSTIGNIGILKIRNGNQNKIETADFLDLDILKEWMSQNELIGLIITGEGRHFSSGANIKRILEHRNHILQLKEKLQKGHTILNYIESLSIPSVAAIGGICFGAGLEIALACHFRICSENAIFAFPESNIGLMPGLSGTLRLPRLIGHNMAMKIIISGKSLNAVNARTIGLVDEIAPKKKAVEYSIDFLKQLTHNKSVQVIKSIIKSINNSRHFTEDRDNVIEHEMDMFCELVQDLEVTP